MWFKCWSWREAESVLVSYEMWSTNFVGASDRHAADGGSIPRCGKGFFSQSQLSVQTLLRVSVHPPCAIGCINICAHVKDPVVHVRVRWIMENTKTSSMHSRLGSATPSQLTYPGESNPNFPWDESHWDNTVVKGLWFCLVFRLFLSSTVLQWPCTSDRTPKSKN